MAVGKIQYIFIYGEINMADNYFVFGEEDFLVMNRVKELCSRQGNGKDLTWAIEKLDSWPEVQDKLCTQAMFSEQRIFVLDYEVILEAKQELDRVIAVISGHVNVLIIYSKAKPDKRTKLFKLISTNTKLIEVVSPKGPDLQRWLVTRAVALGAKKIEHQGAAELIYLAGPNMLTLENELQKLINYNPEITVNTVRKLAIRDVQISIFDLVDSVVLGNTAASLNLVEEIIRGGAEVPYVLHMLARQYRLLFRILFYRQKGYGSPEIQKLVPMHPYAYNKTFQQASNLSANQCAQCLHKIARADYAYKTGQNQGVGMLQMLTISLAKK